MQDGETGHRSEPVAELGTGPCLLAGHGRVQVQKSQVIEASVTTRGVMDGWVLLPGVRGMQGDVGRMSACLAFTLSVAYLLSHEGMEEPLKSASVQEIGTYLSASLLPRATRQPSL